jgi:acyl carrier protein
MSSHLLIDPAGSFELAIEDSSDLAEDERAAAAREWILQQGALFRTHLQRSLPEYMVLSAYVVLAALPLTPNGKIDCRALPAPENAPVIRGEYVAPRTPVEEVLASIWCEVLKLDRVGVHDNFFEFGGHSLLAMRLIARIRDAFQIELLLRALFQAPTVGEFTSSYQSGRTRRQK